jgi:uncharacterized protein (TIGR03503 family)
LATITTLTKKFCFLFALTAGLVSFAYAQQNNDPNVDDPDLLTESESDNPLVLLGEEFNNSIPMLGNRFRIDYNVEEITMVFFREFGSSPVVLVRPDGSKVYTVHANDLDLYWYDTATYDLIKIKNPMPGPWQAVGNILPSSRVMVLTEIQLHAEELPQMIFSGEILKLTAELSNGGKPIEYKEFKDIIELKIHFASTNNPNFENFGAPTAEVARFYDDGRGMDERPMDGMFTGQFNLTIPSGEWKPIYSVETPLYTREVQLDNLLLMANPIQISVNQDPTGESYHELFIDAVREQVEIESLLIDGTVRFPNGETRHFSFTEPSSEARMYQIVSYDYGIYRVKLTAYGRTIFGRDFILNVPEETFVVEDPALSINVAPASSQVATIAGGDSGEAVAAEGDSMAAVAEPVVLEDPVESEIAEIEMQLAELGPVDEEALGDELDEDFSSSPGMDTTTLVIIIAGLNIVILIVGFFVIRRIILGPAPKKPKKAKKKKAKKGNKDEAESEDDEAAVTTEKAA